jgi:hypothetical protein
VSVSHAMQHLTSATRALEKEVCTTHRIVDVVRRPMSHWPDLDNWATCRHQMGREDLSSFARISSRVPDARLHFTNFSSAASIALSGLMVEHGLTSSPAFIEASVRLCTRMLVLLGPPQDARLP